MKKVILSGTYRMMLALVLVATLAASCQTTGSSVAEDSQKGTLSDCARFANQRGGCQDTVGCYWDNSSGSCVMAH